MLSRCLICAVIVGTGCSFSSGGHPSEAEDAITVEGEVVDFQSGAAPSAVSDVTVSGLAPAPEVTRRGAAFSIVDIPANSAFGVLVTAPMYRPSYSQLEVTTSSITGVEAPLVSEAYLASLASGFGVTPSLAKGTVLLHLVDAAGASRAGVAATSFTITGGNGPHFLDANMMAVTAATSSSKSGWVVFFDVPPGIAGLTQPGSAAVTIEMPAVPVAAGVVSIARARVGDGAPALPSNVSFSTQIVPIFAARGCVACHSGSGTGKDLGDLTLSGSANLIYKELVTEKPNTRVRLAAPETSLILTMPSREDPPDGHPNVTFTGPRDPDYLKLLVWIREGAKQN